MPLPRLLAICALAALSCAPAAQGGVAKNPWPPRPTGDPLFLHYGEEHWNDVDAGTILPKIVSETARYRPAMITMSGDKADNGTPGELDAWERFLEPYDRAGIPYFGAIGNNDRLSPPAVQPGLQGLGPIPAVFSSFGPYRDVLADRPYPFGDGRAYPDPRIGPSVRPPEDPQGASTHYVVDYGSVRWIFLDNSCWSISRCDVVQNPPFPDPEGNRGQFDWFERRAAEASRAGRTVFVVMHMPTQDPRDQTHSDPAAFQHVMGKSKSFADNPRFEQVAERTGVDAVFLAHIAAQSFYRGLGRVPYYVDGGAGGALHTNGPVGTDHGYWHGFRVVQVSRGRVITDAVPVFVDGGIALRGPEVLRPGALQRYEAFGRQPVFNGPRKVGTLELRDPRPAAGPVESLPVPARMFTSSNPFVLGPKAPANDDIRRDPRTQTKNGVFRARCPGRARVRVTSGHETTLKNVTVASRPGPVARSVRLTRRRTLRMRVRPRLRHRVATVRLAQGAEVMVRVLRGGRTVRTLKHTCVRAGRLSVLWDGRRRRRGRLVPRGTYRIEAQVRSDRRTVRRARTVRVTRAKPAAGG